MSSSDRISGKTTVMIPLGQLLTVVATLAVVSIGATWKIVDVYIAGVHNEIGDLRHEVGDTPKQLSEAQLSLTKEIGDLKLELSDFKGDMKEMRTSLEDIRSILDPKRFPPKDK